jgi:3'-phosphoadenosine 5'-phosphosulfate sulfotransferase (PAPS reductase)/FAD synthetase
VKKIYDLFVSGGKDSVAAATIGKEGAEKEGAEARIVFIDELKAFEVPEGLLPTTPLDYVKTFAEWLGVDLLVLEPKQSFWEGVKRWGYPHLFHKRWCFAKLKWEPITELAYAEAKQGYFSVWVLGIRRCESRDRCRRYRERRYRYRVGRRTIEYYLPILDWSDAEVESFIRERKIPSNPFWSLGFSCECLCLAGTTRRTLDRMIAQMPQLAKWLAEKDEEVQKHQYKGPSFPSPLLEEKLTLCEYVRKKLNEPRLTDFFGGGNERPVYC